MIICTTTPDFISATIAAAGGVRTGAGITHGMTIIHIGETGGIHIVSTDIGGTTHIIPITIAAGMLPTTTKSHVLYVLSVLTEVLTARQQLQETMLIILREHYLPLPVAVMLPKSLIQVICNPQDLLLAAIVVHICQVRQQEAHTQDKVTITTRATADRKLEPQIPELTKGATGMRLLRRGRDIHLNLLHQTHPVRPREIQEVQEMQNVPPILLLQLQAETVQEAGRAAAREAVAQAGHLRVQAVQAVQGVVQEVNNKEYENEKISFSCNVICDSNIVYS